MNNYMMNMMNMSTFVVGLCVDSTVNVGVDRPCKPVLDLLASAFECLLGLWDRATWCGAVWGLLIAAYAIVQESQGQRTVSVCGFLELE